MYQDMFVQVRFGSATIITNRATIGTWTLPAVNLHMFNEIGYERRLTPIVNYMKVEDKTNPLDYKIVFTFM